MKRRDYLRNISSTAALPILTDRVERIESADVDDFQWSQSVKDGKQILRVETTRPVDEVRLRRYEFSQSSGQPEHKKKTDTRHELVWSDPTTVFGLHSIALRRNEQTVNEVLVDFDIDLLTRHIEARDNNMGRVAVRQKGQGSLAAYSGCVVTDHEQQPDFDVANWQNQHHKQISEEYTVYLQARITDTALQRMRANQTVSVWLRSETDAWFPATVDFGGEGYDPVEVYDLYGVARH